MDSASMNNTSMDNRTMDNTTMDNNTMDKTTMDHTNSATLPVETIVQLNERYADAFFPLVIVLSLVAFVGVVGNIIVLIVFSFSREYKFTNFKIFVMCLALLDLLTCVIMIPAELAKTRHYFHFPDVIPCKIKCFFNIFFNTSVAFALLIICVDRFRKVCQPLKKQISPELALKLCIFVILLSILIAVPAPVMCGILSVPKPNIYNTVTMVQLCISEKKFLKSPLPKVYKLGLAVLLSSISIVMIVMYIMIGRIVFRQSRVRQTMGSFSIETNKSQTASDVQEDTQTENVFLNDEETSQNNLSNTSNSQIYTGQKVKYVPNNEKIVRRQSSCASISSNSNQARISLNKRKSSTSSFRARLRRRQSSISSTGVPYKTLIWLILTLIFIVTYFLYAILAFTVTKTFLMTPGKLLSFTFLFRIYFVNNIINPVIYAWLDRRFKTSCKELFLRMKNRLSRSSNE